MTSNEKCTIYWY